jgi:hypothetical protein
MVYAPLGLFAQIVAVLKLIAAKAEGVFVCFGMRGIT